MLRAGIAAAAFLAVSSAASAEDPVPTEGMMLNAGAFTNCVRSNVLSEKDALHHFHMMGGNVRQALAMRCGDLAASYVHHCQAAGYAEDQCYGDIRLMVDDVVRTDLPSVEGE